MPTARGEVAGGERPGATHAELEGFEPRTGRWLTLPSCLRPDTASPQRW